MKRYGNLFEQICDLENIKSADEKARKNKNKKYGISRHDKHKEENYKKLQQQLLNGTYKTSKYSTFKIYEPKERIIFRLPYYPDRILHHAVMNVLEPIWISIFTKNTYSCIKGRGIHKLVKDLKKDLQKDKEGTKYCLKIDIKKFYPSINHDILKNIIRKKIKDKRLLMLLDSIIDSADGVPIGNYLSQFFANLYLAYFDHWVVEILKILYYYRYCDDMTFLSKSKEELHIVLDKVKEYLKKNLNLDIKNNYQIFPVDARGINFVGYVFYHDYVLLRKSLKLNIHKLINKYNNNQIRFTVFKNSLQSYFGWMKYCNSKHLLQSVYNKCLLRFSNWTGDISIISNFYNKNIKIYNVVTKNRYYELHIIYKNKPFRIKTKSRKTIYRIDKYYPFPFNFTINKKPLVTK